MSWNDLKLVGIGWTGLAWVIIGWNWLERIGMGCSNLEWVVQVNGLEVAIGQIEFKWVGVSSIGFDWAVIS